MKKTWEIENIKGDAETTDTKAEINGEKLSLVNVNIFNTFRRDGSVLTQTETHVWVSETGKVFYAKKSWNDDNSEFVRTDKIGNEIDPTAPVVIAAKSV